MSRKSFSELKRENAEAEEAQKQNQQAEEDAPELDDEFDEEESDEAGELDSESEDESEEDGGSEEDESEDDDEEGDLESWMTGGKQSPDGQEVPLKAHVKMKHKLKGRLEQTESENESLKQEIAELKKMVQGGAQKPQQQEVAPQVDMPKRPSREDYKDEWGDIDYDKYDAAVDDWNIQRLQAIQEQKAQQAQQGQAQKQQLEVLNQTVDKHYDRAEKLVESGMLKPETYQKAETNVLRRLEADVPGHGEETLKALISQVDAVTGDKSALVMFKLGADANALESVLDGFKNGGVTAGISAIARISGEIKEPAKKLTKAKKPAKPIQGDKSATPAVSKLKRKVEAARKRGDTAQAIKIKREARAKGIDTNDW